MAQNDIYDSEGKYKRFMQNYRLFIEKPDIKGTLGERKYYCINPSNLVYFERLFEHFAANDQSYVRRLRLLNTFKLIVSATEKDLSQCDPRDINSIMAFMHSRYKSPKSKGDFVLDLKYLWKVLFPELDERDQIDRTKVPYPVRHLNSKMDKSREVLRNDRFDFEEYKKLIDYFASNKSMQAFIALAVESLARPQELCFLRIKDLELYDNYAKIMLSSHGKEGTGILQCFDSFPEVFGWYQGHPLKNDPEAFLFLNHNRAQFTPASVNKHLRIACKDLHINKRITAYSLKRNGVTFDLLAGKKPQTIQHKARWTSLKQLSTYSKMTQEDNFILEGIKKGKITDLKLVAKYQGFLPGKDERETKECLICGQIVGFQVEICPNCKRHISREKVREELEHASELRKEVDLLRTTIEKHEQRITYLIDNLVPQQS